MEVKTEILPEGEYSLNEALRLTPVRSYQTIRRFVDKGILPAEEKNKGYIIKGNDLIEFVNNLEKGIIKL